MVAAVVGGVPVKPPPSCQRCGCLRGSRHLRNRPTMAVHLNIPLRLPLHNAIRQSIHRRSIVASAPLLPAKATEGAGAVLVLQPQSCTVATAAVSHERFRTIITVTAAVLLLRTPIGTVVVVTTAVLRRGSGDITAGATAATAVWKLVDISRGTMTRFRAT